MTEFDPKALDALMTAETRGGPVLHVRFQGKSQDIPLARLDIGPGSSDETIRQAVARHLDVDVARLNGTVIERHANGNLTLRPEAVFGQ